MSTTTELSTQEIQEFLHYEARLLDDKDWQGWLNCYAPDATYWMPAWDDDGTLTTDPQTQISLIYYPSRAGLEDRIFRINTERSSASSLPEPRTLHLISNLEVLARRPGFVDVRFNWISNAVRYNRTTTYYGTSFYTLDTSGDRPLIKSKKVVLKDDYLQHVIDIYQI